MAWLPMLGIYKVGAGLATRVTRMEDMRMPKAVLLVSSKKA